MINAEGMRSPRSMKGLVLIKLSGGLLAGPFSHFAFDNVTIDREVLDSEMDCKYQLVKEKRVSILIFAYLEL